NEVSLLATASIPNKMNHFYEIPIPDDFLSGGKRLRQISLGLSYTPYVRSTRVTYIASRINFKLVAAESLEYVAKMFDKATKDDEYDNIPELGKCSVNSTLRNKGTVQSATWDFMQFNSNAKLKKNRLFVVVTRNDHPWGEPHTATNERYSLVVCIRDRTNGKARLYTQVQTQLKQKTRARARV
ncbi:serine protease, partial [bacterium]|nr:serine protease [bacterium]